MIARLRWATRPALTSPWTSDSFPLNIGIPKLEATTFRLAGAFNQDASRNPFSAFNTYSVKHAQGRLCKIEMLGIGGQHRSPR
jgi:hypothetical protein